MEPAVVGAIVAAIVGFFGILTAWFYPPVSRRMGLLLKLSSLAEDFSTEAEQLKALKDGTSEKENRLLKADRRKERSEQAKLWFQSVEDLLKSHESFQDQFKDRPSNWNLFKCGFWKNYNLAYEADRQLKPARDLKEQGRAFTDEQLVKQLPDLAVVLIELGDNYKSLSTEIRTLKNLKAHKKARVKDLISQNPGKKEQSRQVGDWFSKVESAVKSSTKTKKDCKAAMNSPCSKPPAPYCSSEQEACPVCNKKYMVGKEVNGLLQQAEDLKTEGRGFTDEQLIISIPEMVVVLRALGANYVSLSREIQKLRVIKAEKEARVKYLISQNPERVEQSDQLGEWLRMVDSMQTMEISVTAMISPCSKTPGLYCSSEQDACDACTEKYIVGKEVNGLLGEVDGLKEVGHGFTDEQLVVCIPEMVVVLRALGAKYESLSTEIQHLKSLKADMHGRVEQLVRQRGYWWKSSSRATDWFRGTESIIGSFSKASKRYRKTRSGSSCTKASSSNAAGVSCSSPTDVCAVCDEKYDLGKEMIRLLEEVHRLKEEEGRFADAEKLVVSVPPDVVEQLPIDFEVFGQKEKLEDALGKIEDREVNMVGICGMGGIGKTTLLQTINNHFFSSGAGDFDVILYTTAGRERVDIPRMQKEIGNRLRLSFSKDCPDEEEQARMILHSLQSMNFLLLLDDLWEKIDLGKLGIPPWSYVPERRRKMVMTARDEKVCTDMGVRERGMVRMGLQSAENSWQLFWKKVGNEDVLRDPEIEAVAGAVAGKCGGLPLALATVGTAMAGATEVHEWRNAKLELEKNARAVAGMEQEVLSPLKFSFDMLENDALRQILFLLLFLLEGGRTEAVYTVSLERHIAGEGLFLSDPKPNLYNWESAVDKAKTLISRLVRSGLLMWHKDKYVRLHDCVRDLLRWLIDSEKDRHPQMVYWDSLSEMNKTERLHSFFAKCEHANRVSMHSCDLEEIPERIEIPCCPNLVVISRPPRRIVRLPERFFDSMKLLRVLDLRVSAIDELPKSIGSLINLTVLDLSLTSLERLPKEIGNLEELKILSLFGTRKLTIIPRECVSRLRRLEEFNISGSAFEWRWSNNDGNGSRQQVALEDLKDLTENGSLRTIHICFWKIDAAIIHGLEHSPRLAASIHWLVLNLCNSNHDVMDMHHRLQALLSSSMKKLELLVLSGPYVGKLGSQFETFQHSLHAELRNPPTLGSFSFLRSLSIYDSSGIFNLAWTRWMPRLQTLDVRDCPDLTAFSSSEEQRSDSEYDNTVPFPHLRKLNIMDCPKLICIARCPSLEELVIHDCPELKNLCLSEENVAKLKKIKGSKEWWDALEWQSDLLKSLFLPRFFQWAADQSQLAIILEYWEQLQKTNIKGVGSGGGANFEEGAPSTD